MGCLFMAHEKLIIGANEITKIIYVGTNVKAKGGKKEKQRRYIDDRKSDFTYDVLGRQVWEKQIAVGKYHVKNYKQRNKNRRNVVGELIYNNFQPNKSAMITLTFANIKKEDVEKSCFDIKEDHPFYEANKAIQTMELNYAAMNDIFSPGAALESAVSIDSENNDERYHDLKTCNKEFKKYIQKMNYRYDNFKYVAVMARQENGNWHYHMICNIVFIDFNELKQVWGLGGVNIQKISSKTQLNKVMNYSCKNMNNAKLDIKGEKGYLASKGLNRNIVLRSWVSSEQTEFNMQNQRLEQAKCINKHETRHTYTGTTRNDDIFDEQKECDCSCIYLTYSIQSLQSFKYLDIATKKKN